jgi:hypothetical protein
MRGDRLEQGLRVGQGLHQVDPVHLGQQRRHTLADEIVVVGEQDP